MDLLLKEIPFSPYCYTLSQQGGEVSLYIRLFISNPFFFSTAHHIYNIFSFSCYVDYDILFYESREKVWWQVIILIDYHLTLIKSLLSLNDLCTFEYYLLPCFLSFLLNLILSLSVLLFFHEKVIAKSHFFNR